MQVHRSFGHDHSGPNCGPTQFLKACDKPASQRSCDFAFKTHLGDGTAGPLFQFDGGILLLLEQQDDLVQAVEAQLQPPVPRVDLQKSCR